LDISLASYKEDKKISTVYFRSCDEQQGISHWQEVMKKKNEMGNHVSQVTTFTDSAIQFITIMLPLCSMLFANIQIRKQCATQDQL